MTDARGMADAIKSMCSPAPALIVMCGLPGLGKSTLARRLALATGAHVVNVDETWSKTGRCSSVEEKQGIVYTRARNVARARLLNGTTTIIDSAALSPDYRARFVGLALERRVPVHCVAIEPDFALSRLRRAHLGPALERMHAAWTQPLLLEGFVTLVNVPACTVERLRW